MNLHTEVGDSVAVDEVIAEIETDKVSTNIFSYPCSGWSLSVIYTTNKL